MFFLYFYFKYFLLISRISHFILILKYKEILKNTLKKIKKYSLKINMKRIIKIENSLILI